MPGAATETILVVEDAEAIRKMICAMLLQNGYAALEASDGFEALQVIERGFDTVNLVLTDVVMPQMGGAELARHVSVLRPELPIVFMSGYTDDPVIRGVRSSNADFLAKPFTADTLVATVRHALMRRPKGRAGNGSQ